MSNEDFEQPEPDSERSAAQPSDAEQAITGDPNKPQRPKRESKAQRIERESREGNAFWRECLSTTVGRRELWRIIAGEDAAHFLQTKFPRGGVGVPDSNEAWYARGEQDLGLRLYHQWVKIDFLAVAKMHQENDPRFKAGE